MDQRLSLITLGVTDLEAMKTFYTEKFGWKIEAGNKDIVFFKLNGLLFSLYGKKDLADAQKKSVGGDYRPYALSYNVNSREEVADVYEDLKSKGVKIIHAPETTPFGGYIFQFEDIEGNVWEVASNPYVKLDSNGNAVSHDSIDNL